MNSIYLVTNRLNGEQYIGSTTKPVARHRWNSHTSAAERNSNTKNKFMLAIRKYGKENFNFEVICSVLDIDDLEIMEEEFIKEYNTMEDGYNTVLPTKTLQFLSKMMKQDWKGPNRAKRLTGVKNGGQKRRLPVVGVNIHSGAIIKFSNVGSVGNEFTFSSIFCSLKRKVLTGQNHIWFYQDTRTDQQYIDEAKQLLGGAFKTNFLIPIIGWNESGTIKFPNTLTETFIGTPFQAKGIRRLCLGLRICKYKGYYWKWDV